MLVGVIIVVQFFSIPALMGHLQKSWIDELFVQSKNRAEHDVFNARHNSETQLCFIYGKHSQFPSWLNSGQASLKIKNKTKTPTHPGDMMYSLGGFHICHTLGLRADDLLWQTFRPKLVSSRASYCKCAVQRMNLVTSFSENLPWMKREGRYGSCMLDSNTRLAHLCHLWSFQGGKNRI